MVSSRGEQQFVLLPVRLRLLQSYLRFVALKLRLGLRACAPPPSGKRRFSGLEAVASGDETWGQIPFS
jgi:hypothetical protein